MLVSANSIEKAPKQNTIMIFFSLMLQLKGLKKYSKIL